ILTPHCVDVGIDEERREGLLHKVRTLKCLDRSVYRAWQRLRVWICVGVELAPRPWLDLGTDSIKPCCKLACHYEIQVAGRARVALLEAVATVSLNHADCNGAVVPAPGISGRAQREVLAPLV